MADETYYGMHNEPGATKSQGGGTFASPNSGWQVMARLPRALLPQGTAKRMGIMVTGQMGNVFHLGANPLKGQFQIALGLDGSLRSGEHVQRMGIVESQNVLGADIGQHFGFLMVQQASPAVADPEFGATTNTTASDFVVYGRMSWNTDQQLYSASFDLMNVQWLWVDIDAMEANGHVQCLLDDSLNAMGPTPVPLVSDAATFGAEGENWMHFGAIQSLVLRPPGLGSAQLQFGSSSVASPSYSSFTRSIEIRQTRGQNYTAAEHTRQSQLAMWAETVPAGTYRREVWGADGVTPNNIGERRVTVMSLRMDVMESAAQYAGPFTETNIVPSVQLPNAIIHTLPLQRLGQTELTAPIVFGCAQPYRLLTNIPESNRGVLADDGYAVIRDGTAFQYEGMFEHMPVLVFGQKTFPPSTQAENVRFGLQRWTNDLFLWDMNQVSFTMAHPVYAPNNAPTPQWIEPNPTTLQVGREGTTIGSLPDVESVPNSQHPIDIAPIRLGKITGKQQYKRTWPVWQKARRRWQLEWGPIRDSDTIVDWLLANPSFRFQPQHQTTKVSVVQSGPVDTEVLGDGRMMVRVKIVELIYVV